MTNAEMNSAEPVPAGAWSERRFALTMLGAAVGLSLVMQISARIVSTYYDPVTPPGIEVIFLVGYTIALPTLAAFYVCWGQSHLIARTVAGLSAVAVSSRAYLTLALVKEFAIYYPRCLVFFAMLLIWAVIFRVSKLRLIHPWLYQHPVNTSRSGQFQLRQLLSWTVSISLVFAFVRLVASEQWSEEFNSVYLLGTRFLICLVPIVAGLLLLTLKKPLFLVALALLACLVPILPRCFSADEKWIQFSMLFGIPIFACLIITLGLLPFRLAGYRLAWKVPASRSQTSTPLNHTEEKPTV